MTTALRAVPAARGGGGPLGLLAEFQTDPLGLLSRLHGENGDIARGRLLWVDNLFVFRPEPVLTLNTSAGLPVTLEPR